MSLNAWDDGNSQTNSMYWVATRPPPGQEHGFSIGTENGGQLPASSHHFLQYSLSLYLSLSLFACFFF
jgi:hypothetical protein